MVIRRNVSRLVTGDGRDAGGGGRGSDFVYNGEGTSELGAGPLGPMLSPKINASPFGNLRSRLVTTSSPQPPARSGAASTIYENQLLLYGGYGGVGRLDDLWSLDMDTKVWTQLEFEGTCPGARENNSVVIMDDRLYVFGGFNGMQWLNDLHEFDLKNRKWRQIEAKGTPPSPRFGYISAAYWDQRLRKELVIFAGFDGSNWLNDMYIYNFHTNTWSAKRLQGEIPSNRSCPSWARCEDKVYMFGGYDGFQRLNDFWELDLKTSTWTPVRQSGAIPSARYYHSSVVYKNHLFVYGGYNGTNRLGDLYDFNLETNTWSKIGIDGETPSGRSSVVLQVYGNALWLLGGFNGRDVLKDLHQLPLEESVIPSPTVLDDLLKLVNNEEFSDVTFMVEGKPVYAVSAILATRCEHFRALLFGPMAEGHRSPDQKIEVPDIEYRIFILLLEFLHTDILKTLSLELDDAVSLLIASERFLLNRLKCLCMEFIRNRIAVDNAVHILVTSYRHNASMLKEFCLDFIVSQFETIKHSPEIFELQREPELLMNLVMRLK